MRLPVSRAGWLRITRWGAVTAVAGGVAVFAQSAVSQDTSAGLALWRGEANCVFCHGWAGDGEGDPHAPGDGPSLRDTALTRDQIAEIIKCGRPGTQMPHFDRFAYTDTRCYGATAEQLGNAVPPRAGTTLQARQINAIADYVAAQLVGKGPVTQEECYAFFSSTNRLCRDYPAADVPAAAPAGA